MELLTQHGYYSVRTHRDNDEVVQVRGRSKADMERFADLTPFPCQIIDDSDRYDFPFRINLPRDRFIEVLAVMGLSLDYTGSPPHGVPNEQRYDVYKTCWGDCIDIEAEPDSGVKVPWSQRQ